VGLATKTLARQMREVAGGHEVWGQMTFFIAYFDRKKGEIGLENTHN